MISCRGNIPRLLESFSVCVEQGSATDYCVKWKSLDHAPRYHDPVG